MTAGGTYVISGVLQTDLKRCKMTGTYKTSEMSFLLRNASIAMISKASWQAMMVASLCTQMAAKARRNESMPEVCCKVGAR
jgi:hypothetical protein